MFINWIELFCVRDHPFRTSANFTGFLIPLFLGRQFFYYCLLSNCGRLKWMVPWLFFIIFNPKMTHQMRHLIVFGQNSVILAIVYGSFKRSQKMGIFSSLWIIHEKNCTVYICLPLLWARMTKTFWTCSCMFLHPNFLFKLVFYCSNVCMYLIWEISSNKLKNYCISNIFSDLHCSKKML